MFEEHFIYENDCNKYDNINVHQTAFLNLNHPELKFRLRHSSTSQRIISLMLGRDILKDCWP